MLKDIFLSFSNNFKQKTTNPFLGTYTTVWVIRHWELVYSIFSFSDDWKIYQKLYFIKSHFNSFNIWNDIVCNILITFGVLLSTFILLNVSRLIVNFFEKQVTPWVYKITDSDSIVLKSVWEDTRNERDIYIKKYDAERESRTKFENKIDVLNSENIRLNEELKRLKEDDDIKLIPNEKIEQNIEETRNSSDIKAMVKRLQDSDNITNFVKMAMQIKIGKPLIKRISDNITINDDRISYIIREGLVRFKERNVISKDEYFQLTEDGENVFNYIRDNEIK